MVSIFSYRGLLLKCDRFVRYIGGGVSSNGVSLLL